MRGLHLTVSEFAVPRGWRYEYVHEMPSIERDIGDYTIVIGYDDSEITRANKHPWIWWLCPKGDQKAISMSDSRDLMSAMADALDALCLLLEKA